MISFRFDRDKDVKVFVALRDTPNMVAQLGDLIGAFVERKRSIKHCHALHSEFRQETSERRIAPLWALTIRRITLTLMRPMTMSGALNAGQLFRTEIVDRDRRESGLIGFVEQIGFLLRDHAFG